jgi:hypothetical protein
LTNASLSRLSQLLKRLESRVSFVVKSTPRTGRFTNASLTKAGYKLLVEALSSAELRQLHDAAERLLARIETSR